MKRGSPGELEFLRSLGVFSGTFPPGWVGPGDDAAVIPSPKGALLFSADLLAEGVHFRTATCPPEAVGYKALAVNVSDLAAMGATPVAATITVTVPEEMSREWYHKLYAGLKEAQNEFACPVVGGDLSRGATITISVAIIGVCGGYAPLLRSGAMAGDDLYLTGNTGESAAGLALLESAAPVNAPEAEFLVARHLRPTPRVAFGREAARGGLASAMIDVSDGVAADCNNIALQSRVRLRIDARLLPLSAQLLKIAGVLGLDPLALALGGGEDYELLLTSPPANGGELADLALEYGLALTRIGSVDEGVGIEVIGPDGRPMKGFSAGFDHFSGQ